MTPPNPNSETIVSAAILGADGKILTGQRHHLILAAMDGSGKGRPQGFMTSAGRFVSREEAMLIAVAAHQIKNKTYNKTKLFSEDLW